MKMILLGEYPIEGKNCLRNKMSADNMKCLQILSEAGYEFAYSGNKKAEKIFDDSLIMPITSYDNPYSRISSLEKQWKALSILCMNEKPMCILIHTLWETHPPCICGEGSSFIDFYRVAAFRWQQDAGCREQAEISGRYIDKQLEFYEQFYGDNTVKIYMSDHGRDTGSPMIESNVHTIFAINGKGIAGRKVDDIFSMVRFPELIRKIIKGEDDWDSLTGEYAIIENLDAYSKKSVDMALHGIISKEDSYQCRGIVTKKDRYFMYATGWEYYFPDLKSDKNEIDNPEYEERIKELRKLCGKEFIDIYQYDKFKYSRLLYEKD